MKITVELYAVCRELAGKDKFTIDLPEKVSRKVFWEKMISEVPALEKISSSVALAHNRKYVKDEMVLTDGDVISLIPPVSGG